MCGTDDLCKVVTGRTTWTVCLSTVSDLPTLLHSNTSLDLSLTRRPRDWEGREGTNIHVSVEGKRTILPESGPSAQSTRDPREDSGSRLQSPGLRSTCSVVVTPRSGHRDGTGAELTPAGGSRP